MKKDLTEEEIKLIALKPYQTKEERELLRKLFDSYEWSEYITYRGERHLDEIVKKRSNSSSEG